MASDSEVTFLRFAFVVVLFCAAACAEEAISEDDQEGEGLSPSEGDTETVGTRHRLSGFQEAEYARFLTVDPKVLKYPELKKFTTYLRMELNDTRHELELKQRSVEALEEEIRGLHATQDMLVLRVDGLTRQSAHLREHIEMYKLEHADEVSRPSECSAQPSLRSFLSCMSICLELWVNVAGYLLSEIWVWFQQSWEISPFPIKCLIGILLLILLAIVKWSKAADWLLVKPMKFLASKMCEMSSWLVKRVGEQLKKLVTKTPTTEQQNLDVTDAQSETNESPADAQPSGSDQVETLQASMMKSDQATLKDFPMVKKRIHSVEDLKRVLDSVTFQLGDVCARVHALLATMEESDEPTSRLVAYLRTQCRKEIKTETLPKSENDARNAGINTDDLWCKMKERALKYFKLSGDDVVSSVQALLRITQRPGETKHQLLARYIAEWESQEPRVPETRAIEIAKQWLPRSFVQAMGTQGAIGSATLAEVAEKFSNFVEWVTLSAWEIEAARNPSPTPAPNRGSDRRRFVDKRTQPNRQVAKRTSGGRPQTGIKCHNCDEYGHSYRNCPHPPRRRLQIVDQQPEASSSSNANRDRLEDTEEHFSDEGGSDQEENACATIRVNAVAKVQTNDFVKHPIHVSFALKNAREEFVPQKFLIDTGSCVNLLPISVIESLGFSRSDLKKNIGEPSSLVGFNGKNTDTLGCLSIPVKLGKVTKDIFFTVGPNIVKYPIMGRPAQAVLNFSVHPQHLSLNKSSN